MNTERLYENASEALRLACLAVHKGDEDGGMGLYNLMVKDPELYLRASDRYLWNDALPALEIYLMAKDELGKAKGGTAYSAMKRFVKSVPDARKDLKGTWNDTEGRQCACDGYRAVRLKKPVDGFESVHGMDLEKVFPHEYMLKEKLDVPTPGQVKIGKKKIHTGRSCYDFGDGYPMVDASFLLDMLALLPNAEVWTTGAEHSMLYFRSDKGDGILLPVRKRDVA